MINLLLTTLIISLFCCGLFCISQEGYLLYFLRKPFDRMSERKIALDNEKVLWKKCFGCCGTVDCTEEEKQRWVDHFKISKSIERKLFLFKPLLGCCTCMASVWGTVVFIMLHGVDVSLWKEWVICCIGAAFVNSVFGDKFIH